MRVPRKMTREASSLRCCSTPRTQIIPMKPLSGQWNGTKWLFEKVDDKRSWRGTCSGFCPYAFLSLLLCVVLSLCRGCRLWCSIFFPLCYCFICRTRCFALFYSLNTLNDFRRWSLLMYDTWYVIYSTEGDSVELDRSPLFWECIPHCFFLSVLSCSSLLALYSVLKWVFFFLYLGWLCEY